jgi:tetratricopeptide (TPR) repeat protein
VAATAEPILTLLSDPPLVSALLARGHSIELFSFLNGFDRPVTSLSIETMGVFVLAPLVLVLAAPIVRGSVRAGLTLVVLALSFALAVGIVVTQIQLALAAYADGQWGIAVFSAAERAALQRWNEVLFVTGMLAFPAFVFLATYAWGLWVQPTPDDGRGGHRTSRLRLWLPPFAVVVLVGATGVGLALVPPASRVADDYHEGWARVLQLNPGFVPAQVRVALHLQSTGNLDEAVEIYRTAIAARPEMPELHYNLANALVQQGRDEQAMESYRVALTLEPGHPAAHRNLGLALERAGRPCEAAHHLRQSVGLGDPASREELPRAIERLEAACAG